MNNKIKHINRLILGLSLFMLPVALTAITSNIGWHDFFKMLFNVQVFIIGGYIEGLIVIRIFNKEE